MPHRKPASSWKPWAALAALGAASAGVLTAAGCGSSQLISSGIPGGTVTTQQVQNGRYLVTSVGCADCHNRGKDDPSDTNWLAGYLPGTPGQPYQIGPPGQALAVYAANITPDQTTGIGKYTDRQIYNALKFGLDPADTPDVEITSTTPGQGNYPATPHYLAPPMPWPSFRHFTDIDLWAIVAYVKHGVKPVSNAVPASQAPPDFWASYYSAANVGPATLPNYPTANEPFTP